jgi:hypothetical protein
MQLMRLTDVPPINQSDRIFLYSRLRAVVGGALLAASALGAFLLAWFNGAWLGYYIAAVLLTLLLIFQNLITARFRSSNWLLRVTDHGLFIKFRSYLNHHFDQRDLTVVFLPYSEIRSAREMTEIHRIPDRDNGSRAGTMTKTRRAVELELAGDCTALSKLLANERERVFAKSVIGAGRLSTRYQHLPVRMAGSKLLSIDWGVVPSVETLLTSLTRHTVVQDSAAVSKDFTELETLSKEQQEARLVELVQCGESMAAIALARRLYSYDLARAKQFVEELAQRQTTR